VDGSTVGPAGPDASLATVALVPWKRRSGSAAEAMARVVAARVAFNMIKLYLIGQSRLPN
jgi:type II secretory pathway pseudopilin PulG